MRRGFALLFVLTIVVSLGSAPQARAATSEFRALWVDAFGWNPGPRLDHHHGSLEQLDPTGGSGSRLQLARAEQDRIRQLARREVRRGPSRKLEFGRELVLRSGASRRRRVYRGDVSLGGAKLRHRRAQL